MFFFPGSVAGLTDSYLWITVLAFVFMAIPYMTGFVPAFPELVANAEDVYEGKNYDSEDLYLRLGGVFNFTVSFGMGVGPFIG